MVSLLISFIRNNQENKYVTIQFYIDCFNRLKRNNLLKALSTREGFSTDKCENYFTTTRHICNRRC
jgi:hypothetical protein